MKHIRCSTYHSFILSIYNNVFTISVLSDWNLGSQSHQWAKVLSLLLYQYSQIRIFKVIEMIIGAYHKIYFLYVWCCWISCCVAISKLDFFFHWLINLLWWITYIDQHNFVLLTIYVFLSWNYFTLDTVISSLNKSNKSKAKPLLYTKVELYNLKIYSNHHSLVSLLFHEIETEFIMKKNWMYGECSR